MPKGSWKGKKVSGKKKVFKNHIRRKNVVGVHSALTRSIDCKYQKFVAIQKNVCVKGPATCTSGRPIHGAAPTAYRQRGFQVTIGIKKPWFHASNACNQIDSPNLWKLVVAPSDRPGTPKARIARTEA